jgi:hypothetical protein
MQAGSNAIHVANSFRSPSFGSSEIFASDDFHHFS